MKRMMVSFVVAAVASMVAVGCAADPTSPDDESNDPSASTKAEAPVAVVEPGVDPQLAFDHGKFCLPGEKVKCTLGPPPVCSCVPDVPPILTWR